MFPKKSCFGRFAPKVRGMFELNFLTTGTLNYWDVEQLAWTQ